jgi:hypothetical protein
MPVAPTITAPVPAPAAGGIANTVSPGKLSTKAAVAITAPADFGNGVSAAVLSAKLAEAVAVRPGEISGPAVQLSVQVTNASKAVVSLANVTLNAQDAAGTPFVQMYSPPAAPFAGSVTPGAKASATYVYELPSGYRNPLTLSLSYSTTAPVVVFVGEAK